MMDNNSPFSEEELADYGDNLAADTKFSMPDATPDNPVGVLELAQKVYDEMLAEAKAKSDDIVKSAQEKSYELLANAQAEADEKLAQAAQEHVRLQEKIETMTQFEAAYRQKLEQLVRSAKNTLEVDFFDDSRPNDSHDHVIVDAN